MLDVVLLLSCLQLKNTALSAGYLKNVCKWKCQRLYEINSFTPKLIYPQFINSWKPRYVDMNLQRLSPNQVVYGLVGMWRILLAICWSSPDQHRGGSIDSQLQSLQILPKLTIDWPPRINIFRGNPCKVFTDPFQVDHRLTCPGSTLSEVILAKSLQILSKLTVNWPPPRINIVRGTPSKVITDPFQVDCQLTPQDQHCQR